MNTTKENKFEKFNDKLAKYHSNSVQDDYADLVENFDREKAKLSVAYHVYGADINEAMYEYIRDMSKSELLQALKDEISESDGSDEFDHDSDEDSYAYDDWLDFLTNSESALTWALFYC